jgi:membrane-associated protein
MFDPAHMIQAGGLVLIALIIFAETGLLFGFFLPGDTLLFSAGIFAAQGQFSIYLAITVIIFAAIAGNTVGYYIGKHGGRRIFKQKDGLFFRAEYIDRAAEFYEKHGWKTILLARFIPIVRTFAPVVAGIGSMDARAFLLYNVLGAILWGGSLTTLGYFFGSYIPNIEHYVMPVVLGAMAISFGPMIYHLAKNLLSRPKQ